MSQNGQGYYMQSIQQNVTTLVQHVYPAFTFSIADTITRIQSFLSDNLTTFISQTVYTFFQIFFLLFAFFFFLRDGGGMLNTITSLSPFGKEQNKEIIDSVYRTITSVIRGTLFVGLVRLILFAGAFYLFGIPNALFWASIGGIIAVIPGLGTPFVIIPASLYLFFSTNIFLTVGMLIFGGLIFFFIDNLLSTYFFGKGLAVPPIFVLFSILGGVITFGPLGFIFGPIILSLFISVIDMYKILVLKKE
jgi:predicted PurR-regulated permease PerM